MTSSTTRSAEAGPPTIVIVGGGYAGLYAAQRARQRWFRKRIRVVLVAPSMTWVERTRLHQVAVGDDSVRRWDIHRFFAGSGVELVEATVSRVDADAREILVRDANGPRTIAYTTLVLATGSRANLDTIPGAAEHGHVLDHPDSAARITSRLEELTADRSVVVIGNGTVGIEVATEIAERRPDLRLSLVAPSTHSIGLRPKARDHVQACVDRHGIDLVRASAAEVTATSVLTSDGSIPSDLTICSAGLVVPPLGQDAGLATDPGGRVLVDNTMRSISHPDVFAAGDCARVTEHVGAPVRMSAFTAIILGATAGRNARRREQRRRLRALSFGYLFLAISLGRSDAVVQLLTRDDRSARWVITGRPAVWIKNATEHYLVVGGIRLERLLPVAFAWRPGRRTASPTI